MAVGQTPSQIQQALGNQSEAKRHELVFIPAFSAASHFPEVDTMIMQYYHYLILGEIRKSAWFFWQWIDRFDYSLHLPEYERFTLARQRNFEYQLQTQLNARRVFVNGKSVELPELSRRFERLLHFIFLDLLPWGILLSGIGILGKAPSALAAMLILITSPVVTLAVAWVGKFIWLFLAHPALPKSYLHFRLSQRRSSLLTLGDSVFNKLFLGGELA